MHAHRRVDPSKWSSTCHALFVRDVLTKYKAHTQEDLKRSGALTALVEFLHDSLSTLTPSVLSGRCGVGLEAGHASAERLRDNDAADRLKPAHTDGTSGFQLSLVDALERATEYLC